MKDFMCFWKKKQNILYIYTIIIFMNVGVHLGTQLYICEGEFSSGF